MKKVLFQIFIPLLTLAFLTGCFSGRKSGGKSSQRMAFHKHGVIIEAHYDPRLDGLIPGYKILTVALTNHGTDVLRLNPLKDRWEVTDAIGKNRKAINSLRIKDPAVFAHLPGKVQQLVDYPVGISVGYSETVDLFFPGNVDLRSFRAISYYSEDRKQKFDMMTHLDSPTHVKAPLGKKVENDPRFKANRAEN